MKSRAEMLAYCGLDCLGCPIHLATQVADDARKRQMREDIARQIEQLYGVKCTADGITDCDGCRADKGRIFSACQKCGVRSCARARGLENCARCNEYACEMLEKFFSYGGKLVHGDARARLDTIRKTMCKDGK